MKETKSITTTLKSTPKEESTYPSDFGVWLRNERLKLNFTQQQMADWICVSQQTITAWETGRTRSPMLSIGSVKKLCMITRTPLELVPNGEEDVVYNLGDEAENK